MSTVIFVVENKTFVVNREDLMRESEIWNELLSGSDNSKKTSIHLNDVSSSTMDLLERYLDERLSDILNEFQFENLRQLAQRYRMANLLRFTKREQASIRIPSLRRCQ